MSLSASQAQSDRISAYRKRRPPDSQSDSQARPWGDVSGVARPLESQPSSAPSAAVYNSIPNAATAAAAYRPAPAGAMPPGPPGGYDPRIPYVTVAPPTPVTRSLPAATPPGPMSGGAFGFAMNGMVNSPAPSASYRPPPPPPPPQQQQPQQQPAFGMMGSAPTTSIAALGGFDANRSGSAAPSQHDVDIRSYIFDLELQNRELRKQMEIMAQDALPSSAALALGSDEAKRDFLTNVLVQVEGIVEAHRNKANAEIQKYKAEADQARLALEQLRNVIQTEGLDLTLAPAMIAFHKRQQRAHAEGKGAAPSPLGINFPKEVDDMLHQVAVDILTKLQSVTDRDQLGTTMREAVRTGFQSIVIHFTDEVINATKKQEAMISTLQAELDAAKHDIRSVTLAHESKRVELVSEHALEMDAMKDQLRILTANLGGSDQLSHAMHEKAFGEYAQLLTEARRETAALKAEMDAERTRSAEVCLKLKATLERRREEFEKDLVAKAEEVVAQRDRTISELETRLQRRESEFAARYADKREVGLQAGEPLVAMPNKENFVPQLVNGLHKQSRATAQSNELFERDVWRKTQELLTKYGTSMNAAASPAASA